MQQTSDRWPHPSPRPLPVDWPVGCFPGRERPGCRGASDGITDICLGSGLNWYRAHEALSDSEEEDDYLIFKISVN